jgi:hypothetical protein
VHPAVWYPEGIYNGVPAIGLSLSMIGVSTFFSGARVILWNIFPLESCEENRNYYCFLLLSIPIIVFLKLIVDLKAEPGDYRRTFCFYMVGDPLTEDNSV